MTSRAANRITILVLLSTLLCALWGFFGYWAVSSRHRTLESNRVQLEQLTSAVKEQTLRLFKLLETSLTVSNRWLADHPGVDPGDDAGFISLVDGLRRASGNLIDVRMVTRDGGLHYVPKRSLTALADVSDRDYVLAQQDPASRGLFIGRAILSRYTGKWGIPMSVPAEGGGDIGVLFGFIELDRFVPLHEPQRLKPSGSISILRSDGVFLSRAPFDPDIVTRSLADNSDYTDHMAKDDHGVFRSDSAVTDGVKRIVSFGRLKDYPLIVVVSAGLDDVLAPWRSETRTLGATLAVITLASILLIAHLLRTMTATDHAERDADSARRRGDMILSSVGEGICGIDPDGTASFINAAATRMTGWGGEVIGRSLHGVLHHRQSTGDDSAITCTLDDGKARQVADEVFWRRDGSTFPAEYTVTGIRQDGHVTGAVMVFRDITDRLQTEQTLLKRTEELARSNTELEEFASIASHDLRQPLRAISGYLNLLERNNAGQLDAQGREFLDSARTGAQQMSCLISDLLDFAHIGRSGHTPEPVDLRKALDSALANLGPAIRDCGASIEIDGQWPSIDGVPSEILRLFQNLIGNAIKYHAKDRPPVVRIGAKRRARGWEISISDNGIGIPADRLDHVFGIFQRLHGTTEYEGTGIGLAACRKIVERHGGQIWLTSEVDTGSVFTVFLPVDSVPADLIPS
ncbi:MAG TPA: ATP-binding protein [Patescibacteria group bacterium]|nr:ATP-binding protein [Patescibacteria group bacterium]